MTGTLQPDTAPAILRRVHVDVEGTVQGVGFRPFVFRLAKSLGLGGFVRNDTAGVSIEIEGADASIERFLTRLRVEAPAHATIARVMVTERVPLRNDGAFSVRHSVHGGAPSASIAADRATCGACLRELFDPTNRRYRYPFINCIDCGPRFTISLGIPYDRATTTMASFEMCATCQAEFDEPSNRRFHAQPNACAECGPRLALTDDRGLIIATDRAIAVATDAIRDGAILAVKGLGGYHLACRADDSAVVRRLRDRKHRDRKPFAIMLRTIRAARKVSNIDRHEGRLLTSAARPIVLVRARAPNDVSGIAPEVAPGRCELGVLLPYTPIHHLLLAQLDMPLVMTSGNRSDEPIAYRDDDVIAQLAPIADLFLSHNRPIATRCDDSIVRKVRIGRRRQTLVIRRSRGLVPEPLTLPSDAPHPLLAVGGHLKNTACVAHRVQAIVGPHCGDLGDASAFAAYVASVSQLQTLSGGPPAMVAHDLHPEYASTKYALDRTDLAAIGVQHHHAHLAACLAEYGETGPAIGLIFDGAGFGTDATIWGGEILFGDLGACVRIGHLYPIRMPGGDAVVREPWRMACAWLSETHGRTPPLCRTLRDVVDPQHWEHVARTVRSSSTLPFTTSVGRLVDACAAICGVAARVTHEGEAAIELEALADPTISDGYPIAVRDHNGVIVIDPRPLVRAVERDANAGCDISAISARVHRGLVYAATLSARHAAARTGTRTVVLSGGVFQNVLLLESLAASLAAEGFRVLVPRRLPPNDGGLSYGQAVIGVELARWRPDVPGDSRAGR